MSDNNQNSTFVNLPAFRIASIAIMIAVTAIFTTIIRIPTAPTRGYLNFGDVAIFFTAITFGPWTALIAGGAGTALADILGGYAQWAPYTFIAHGGQGLIIGLIVYAGRKKTEGKTGIVSLIVAFIAASIVMVGTYFLTGGFMYGFGAAATEIPGNILQNAAGILVGAPLSAAVRKAYPPVSTYGW